MIVRGDAENARRWLNDRIYPELGSRPADSVAPAEVLALIRRVAKEGHAKTAEYIRQTLSRIFQHGVRNLCCKGDPAHACRGAIVVPPAVHHRPLCRTRVRSSGRILHFSRSDNLITEIVAQVLRRAQVNTSTRGKDSQLGLDARQPKQPRFMAWLEFNEQVYVAVRPVCAPQRRAEERQASNMVAAADRR